MALVYLNCPVCNERVQINDKDSPKTVEASCGDKFMSLRGGGTRRIKSGALTKRLNFLKKVDKSRPKLEVVYERPPQVKQLVETKLLTSAILSENLNQAPKKDVKLGKLTLRKMSQRFQTIQKKGEFVEKFLKNIEGKDFKLTTLSEGAYSQLDTKLNELIQASEEYAKKHIEDPVKLDAVQKVLTNAKSFQANLQSVRTDPDYNKIKSRVTLQQALALKRRRIAFKDCNFEDFNDGGLKLDQCNEKFGSGAANSVAKLVHRDGKPRVFKREPETDTSGLDGPSRIGLDKDDPHYGNRNIASYLTAKLLDTTSIAESRYALHNGEIGLLMEMAPGKTPRQKVTRPVDTGNETLQKTIKAGKVALEKKGYFEDPIGTWKQTQPEIVNPFGSRKPNEDETAELHLELNNLEWCDMLSGQMDRHAENYLIEVKGGKVKVTGIDNDLCFGSSQSRIESKKVNDAYRGTGLPKLIDRKTFNKLTALNFDRDVLPGLTGLLSSQEIEASRERFRLVQQEARKLETAKCVVDDWKAWRSNPGGKTATEFMKDPVSGGGLFNRDFGKFF